MALELVDKNNNKESPFLQQLCNSFVTDALIVSTQITLLYILLTQLTFYWESHCLHRNSVIWERKIVLNLQFATARGTENSFFAWLLGPLLLHTVIQDYQISFHKSCQYSLKIGKRKLWCRFLNSFILFFVTHDGDM